MECIRNSLKIEQKGPEQKGPEHLASLKTTVVNKLYAVQLQPSTFSLRKALGTFSKMEDLSKDIENVPKCCRGVGTKRRLHFSRRPAIVADLGPEALEMSEYANAFIGPICAALLVVNARK